MEWIDEFAKKFIERRAEAESFSPEKHSFFVHDPETEFIKVMLTGYIKNYYYMSFLDVLEHSADLHRCMLSRNPEFHLKVTEIARNTGMKDQVMLSLLFWCKHPKRKENEDKIVELLKTFPPNQIVRKFVDVKRQKATAGGLGSFEKRVLRRVLAEWDKEGRMSYYLAKYRNAMRTLIKLSHYCLDKERWTFLIKPTHYMGSDEYLLDVAKIIANRSAERVSSERIPFEIIRSNISKSFWSVDLLKKTDMTGLTLVMQATSLYEVFEQKNEEKEFLKILKESAKKAKYLTTDKVLKACLASERKGYSELAETLAHIYADKIRKVYKDLLLPVEKPRIALVLDASGSMMPGSLKGMFFNAVAVVTPFAPLVHNLILFSEDADYEDKGMLMSYESLLRLNSIAKEKYNGGTDISAGLKLALESAESGEVNLVVIATDEQANILKHEKEQDLIEEIKRYAEVMLVNPTPYPVHIATDIIYVPAPNAEAVVSAVKLAQLKKVKSREIISLLKAH